MWSFIKYLQNVDSLFPVRINPCWHLFFGFVSYLCHNLTQKRFPLLFVTEWEIIKCNNHQLLKMKRWQISQLFHKCLCVIGYDLGLHYLEGPFLQVLPAPVMIGPLDTCLHLPLPKTHSRIMITLHLFGPVEWEPIFIQTE